VIELRCAGATAVISPDDGGRIASLRAEGVELLVGQEQHPMMWGSFPMVPWAGRVRDGRFEFAGRTYHLPRNLAPHAIHGTGFVAPWDVVAVDGASVSIRAELADPWPFGGVARQRIELAEDGVTCTLAVTAGDEPMPAQVGWHPWFVKPMDAHLRFSRMYHRDAAGIPTGDVIAAPEGPWDDCFVEPLAAIELQYVDLVVTVNSDCDHWVVYDQPTHATCVEPQSGPPDGFTLAPQVLRPGETLERVMSITWRRPATGR
jgi:aldose 1-epimerase